MSILQYKTKSLMVSFELKLDVNQWIYCQEDLMVKACCEIGT